MVAYAIAALAFGVTAGCTVTAVDPVLPQHEMIMLCLDHNPEAGASYDSEIGALLDSMGIKNRMTGGAFPGECRHRLQTSVSWSESPRPYLLALELVITEDHRPLGDASYRVRQTFRSSQQLGSAASKAKPLLEELLQEYNPKSASRQPEPLQAPPD